MERSGAASECLSDINVTPLVDVMLVLLIVLMVTSSYAVTKGLEVNLPKASSGERLSVTLNLQIDARGSWRLDGQPTDAAAVRRTVRAQLAAGTELGAVIAADGESRHHQIVEVLDLLRSERVEQVAFGVLPDLEGG
jgi:biopolymer transport protein ExbD